MEEATNNGSVGNSVNQSIADYIETMSLDQMGLLQSIDLTLKGIARQDGIKISQSSLNDLMKAELRNDKLVQRQRGQQASADARRKSSGNQSQDTQQGYQRRSKTDDWFDFDKRSGRAKAGKMFDKLTDDFEDVLTEALFGSKNPINDVINKSIKNFAKSLGDDVKVSDLGTEIGKRVLKNLDNIPYKSILTGQTTTLYKQLAGEFKSIFDGVGSVVNGGLSSLSKSLGGTGNLDDVVDSVTNAKSDADEIRKAAQSAGEETARAVKKAVNQEDNIIDVEEVSPGRFKPISRQNVADNVVNETQDAAGDKQLPALLGDVAQSVTKLGQSSLTTGTDMVEVGAQVSGLTAELGPIAATMPEILPIILAAGVALEVLTECIGPAVEGIGKFVNAIMNAGMRNATLNAKYTDLQQKRLEANIDSITRAAYKIIEDSAEKIQNVWDSVESTVAATQNKTKAEVQDLWSSYASRLKEAGLASVVSSADIMSQLESVLKQGLSGRVAEEFAYQATLFNKAIPTEDFFQYASTYASVAANAMRKGSNLEGALVVANSQLKSFATNLLYASRDLSGGFTTSLSNAADLFKKSADITQAAHKISTTATSQALTAVAGIAGSIAPDLADGIVDAVYKAAVGGNSSEITALRSMAGVGAGNTAFLQAFIADPKGILQTLFTNLAQLQNMSSSNYMEVAEGLASVFGISMDAFTRIDFKYLADKIGSIGDAAEVQEEFGKSLENLMSGETTSNDEQMRIQKINEYMIEEGLAYVLDNEAARAIQQHMWDEQLNQELATNTYSVELVGATLSMLSGIKTTVETIENLMLPSGWVNQIENIALTKAEIDALNEDLNNILEYGKVGQGNAQEFTELTTSGQRLNLATPIVELISGGKVTSAYDELHRLIESEQEYDPIVEGVIDPIAKWVPPLGAVSELVQHWGSITNAKSADEVIDALKDTVVDVGQHIGTDLADRLVGITNPAVGLIKDLNTAKDLIDGVGGLVSGLSNSQKSIDNANQESIKSAEATSRAFKRVSKSSASIAQSSQAMASSIQSTIRKTVSKNTAAKLTARSSSNWRSDSGYNPLWSYVDTETASRNPMDPGELSEKINTSIVEYVDALTQQSTVSDNLRKEITENTNDILIERDAALLKSAGIVQHRGFLTNQEMVDEVANQILTGTQYSYEDWLTKFEEDLRETLHISAEDKDWSLETYLSNYNASIDQVAALYQQQQQVHQDALTKARDLHEVQFWEDMQQFATVDFPWYMREWERYYIQHEAYTDATNEAYAEAVSLSVKEKGEMGDSVLALAEALTENNIWQQELGDKLKDPVMHTNVILSKILLVVEAIMQQNNETSIVSVPTALSALGLSISNV